MKKVLNDPVVDVSISSLVAPALYLITGAPGSGKTHYALKLKSERGINHHYEADMWMVNGLGSYWFDYRRLEYCHAQCFNAVERAMERREDVIVSNTFLTRKEAKPYIWSARKNNCNIVLIHLTTHFVSVHDVPADKIQQMRNRRELFTIADF